MLEVRVETSGGRDVLRVRTDITTSRDAWTATLLQDRRTAWQGSARGGEIDRRVRDLPGSEVLAVRLRDQAGTVCAAELTIPA